MYDNEILNLDIQNYKPSCTLEHFNHLYYDQNARLLQSKWVVALSSILSTLESS